MLDPKLHKYISLKPNEFSVIGFADFNFFAESLSNVDFNQALDVFDKIYCDGYWLYRILRFFNYNVEYYPGPNYFLNFVKEGHSGIVLSKYCFVDLKTNSGLNISMVQLPFFDDVDEFNFEEIVENINRNEHIFVSLGCPKQEIFISKLKCLLGPQYNLYAVGAAIDFFLDKELRAPLFIQRLRIEFFWRLIVSFKKQSKKWVKFPKIILWIIINLFRSNEI
jgi:UDP-N-acetyl-D-mannosaminuronic acid transferase (WecB/TagA/CpsF family)